MKQSGESRPQSMPEKLRFAQSSILKRFRGVLPRPALEEVASAVAPAEPVDASKQPHTGKKSRLRPFLPVAAAAVRLGARGPGL